MTELLILLLVIGTALAFDFTNGFHDTANAMATSIATKALKPKTAVALAGLLNLVGAFLSVEVAKTVANGIVNLEDFDLSVVAETDKLLLVVFAGLIGGILWNLFTWLFGLPSSSSHALFGGLIGAAIAALGVSGVVWDGVLQKIIVPALAAPVIAGLVAAVGTAGVFKLTRRTREGERDNLFRLGQIGSASLVALAHGTSDAQKTMGVIFLALVASGNLDAAADMPFWVTASCAIAIAAGTYAGGWRVIRTLGKGLVEITSPQGMAAETSSAAIILTSAHMGMALSTTHVATGSILGSGVGKPGAKVRWGVAGRMGIAWITTLPLAAAVSWLVWTLSNLVAEATTMAVGSLFSFLILATGVGLIVYKARKQPVHADNVNEDWDEHGLAPETGASATVGTVSGADTDSDETPAKQDSDTFVHALAGAGVGTTPDGSTFDDPVIGRGDPASVLDTSAGYPTSTSKES